VNKFAPSLFAADFSDLPKALELFKTVGVDMIHYDVMDNHFVPNISFGPKIISDVMKRSGIPADIHLMIDLDQPERYRDFLELPASLITVHYEAVRSDLFGVLEEIRKSGKMAGVSLKPSTPVEDVQPFLDRVDLVLLMSVEPGFSGQKFMPESFARLRELKNLIGGRRIDIQIDGGIGRDNYLQVLSCGANFLVMGSGFFTDKNVEELCKKIREQ
jgi:ribulose-phosphate 3-epimerase